jgi:hypothetical protein
MIRPTGFRHSLGAVGCIAGRGFGWAPLSSGLGLVASAIDNSLAFEKGKPHRHGE